MVKRVALAVVVLGLAGGVFAQESRPANGGGNRGNRPQVPSSLGAAMRDMGQAWDRLKTEASDSSKKDAALTDVVLMERDAAISKTATPPTARNLTGDDKAKNIAEFRADFTKLQHALLDLEDAINTGDMDGVKTSSAKVHDIEKAGHGEFRPKEH